MSLGEELRRLRLNSQRGRLGATQIEREYGLHRQTVYLWESASSRPEPVELRKYLEWLGASEVEIQHVLTLRSLPAGVVEDDIPTRPDDTPTLEDDGPTAADEVA